MEQKAQFEKENERLITEVNAAKLQRQRDAPEHQVRRNRGSKPRGRRCCRHRRCFAAASPPLPPPLPPPPLAPLLIRRGLAPAQELVADNQQREAVVHNLFNKQTEVQNECQSIKAELRKVEDAIREADLQLLDATEERDRCVAAPTACA